MVGVCTRENQGCNALHLELESIALTGTPGAWLLRRIDSKEKRETTRVWLRGRKGPSASASEKPAAHPKPGNSAGAAPGPAGTGVTDLRLARAAPPPTQQAQSSRGKAENHGIHMGIKSDRKAKTTAVPPPPGSDS